jgi:hypothetical protein
MGKKGIHINSRPILSSSAGAFEKRGDKWVTDKEGVREYGRNLDTENAERDWWFAYNGDTQHTSARLSSPRVEQLGAKGQSSSRDRQVIARLNIATDLKRQMREPREVKGSKRSQPVVPHFLEPHLPPKEQKEVERMRQVGKREQKELQRKILSIKPFNPSNGRS